MLITISDLRRITEKIYTFLEETNTDTIKLSVEYYWHIIREQLYNPYDEPTEFTLGQLSDDWAELNKILEEKNTPINYNLVWLASILRAIGEQLSS